MYSNESKRQKPSWGAAGQCLLILLSFFPVWLLRAGDVPETEVETTDTLVVMNRLPQAAAEAAYSLEVPRP